MGRCLVSLLFVVITISVTFGHYDAEKGVSVGDIQIGSVNCQVWAVTSKALNLDCALKVDDLEFELNEQKLATVNRAGRIILVIRDEPLDQSKKYTLTMKSKDGTKSVGLSIREELPKPASLGSLPRATHGVASGDIVVLNSQTLSIPSFNYNGDAPDAFFWVGKGDTPNADGQMIPDENGSKQILRKYAGKDLRLRLPEDLRISDIGYFSVWCREYKENFGHVVVPKKLIVPPAYYLEENFQPSGSSIMEITSYLILTMCTLMKLL